MKTTATPAGWFAALILTAMAASFARGQEPPGAENALAERFRRLDRNGDGRVTAEEMGSPDWHRRLDVDGDGFLTFEEARRALAGREGAGGADRGPGDALAYRKDSSGPVPLSRSRAFTDLVFARDDATGTWTRSVISSARARSFEVRLLFTHRDRVTGVHGVFAALTSGSLHRGAYAPESPGRIRWDPEPELEGRLARIMSSGHANGEAYLAVDITPDQPGNGGLFRRVDGERPRWEWIGEWGPRLDHRGVAWMRGLTAIPDPAHPEREILLASREVGGVIEAIDPGNGHERRVEFDLRKHFGGLVGARDGQRVTTIFAHNEMTPAVHPDTGDRVLLIGGGVLPAPPGEDARAKGAWYLVRHAGGRYATGRVFDPEFVPQVFGGLRCVRTICASPFPEDQGRVFYFGGFDAGDFGTGVRYRDTAWIYRAVLPSTDRENPR